MAFHEIRLPIDPAYGMAGGPRRRTQIAILGSGFEERNAIWRHSRRKYNAGYGIKTFDQLLEVVSFWEARNAGLHSFRVRDHIDYKSCAPSAEISMLDMQIGIGDGERTKFQLSKTYGDVVATYVRPIVKPDPRVEVLVAVDEARAHHSDYSVNYTNGVVTFDVPPADNKAVTAGFWFDVPVRFDTDDLNIVVESWKLGVVPDVPLIEVRIVLDEDAEGSIDDADFGPATGPATYRPQR